MEKASSICDSDLRRTEGSRQFEGLVEVARHSRRDGGVRIRRLDVSQTIGPPADPLKVFLRLVGLNTDNSLIVNSPAHASRARQIASAGCVRRLQTAEDLEASAVSSAGIEGTRTAAVVEADKQ